MTTTLQRRSDAASKRSVSFSGDGLPRSVGWLENDRRLHSRQPGAEAFYLLPRSRGEDDHLGDGEDPPPGGFLDAGQLVLD